MQSFYTYNEEWIKFEAPMDKGNLIVSKSLTTLDNSNGKIGDYTFYQYKRLEDVRIKATYVGEYAFAECDILSTVDLRKPWDDGVPIAIKEGAFKDCVNLKTINYWGTKNWWKERVILGANWDLNTGDYVIKCSDGTIAKDGTET